MNAALRSLLVSCLVFGGVPAFSAPAAPQNPMASIGALNLVVIEGQGEVNNIKQRNARDLIVEVDDQNHKPVSEALLTFALPSAGAGGTFAGGLLVLKVTTDKNGRAVARGFQPNDLAGPFNITVTAAYGALTATAIITETNAVLAAAVAGGAAAGTAIGIHTAAAVTVLGTVAVAGTVLATVLPVALKGNAPAASPR